MSSYEPGPPPEPAPGYQAPYAAGPPPAAQNPGRTLGIVGFVLSFFTALVGLIVSIVALRQSKKAGYKNGFALAGVIIGAVGTVVAVVAITVGVIGAAHLVQACKELGPGTHQVNGVTYTCS